MVTLAPPLMPPNEQKMYFHNGNKYFRSIKHIRTYSAASSASPFMCYEIQLFCNDYYVSKTGMLHVTTTDSIYFSSITDKQFIYSQYSALRCKNVATLT